MILDIQERQYFERSQLIHVEDEYIDAPLREPVLYEVIRVMSGKPVFLKEHMARLRESVGLTGGTLGSWFSELEQTVCKAPEAFRLMDNNLKIMLSHPEEQDPLWYVYPVKSFYPPESWYEEGVDTISIEAVRNNPNAKQIFRDLKNQVARAQQELGIWEALLINEKGYVTEGSRSNLFFIQGKTIYSARSCDVLKGITRLKVLEAIEGTDLSFVEGDISIEKMYEMDGAFLTGTSIHVLPIRQIDDVKFGTAQLPAYKQVQQQFAAVLQREVFGEQED